MRETTVVDAEIQHLESQLARLAQGALDPELFKKLRLQYGVYSMRRAPDSYMIRVRVPLGIITPEQLEALATACEQFTPARQVHVTTRQDAQLYGVERGAVPAFLRGLSAAGLTTREASGNVVRNITLCPWAGVSREEPFDVTPYAQAISDYLLRNPLTQILPRKVKIAFEGCPTDHARTQIHDLGIVAAVQDGRRGFRIYAGGGLGPAPAAAKLLEPWTEAELLLPTIEAVLRVFERHGERRNRARARLKFLIEQLGWEEFRQRVMAERPAVWATQSGYALSALHLRDDASPPVRACLSSTHPAPEGFARWSTTNIVPQKQPRLVSVIVRAPCGDLSSAQLRGLADVARRYAGGARLMNTQNVLLRFVPYAALPAVYEELERLGLAEAGADRLADVTRCPGADSCLSAITHPRGFAEAVDALCRNGLSAWADAPISIKISGCPNACGQHHIADIGGFGVAVKVGERHVPCYQLLVGGGTAEESTQFGRRLLRVPAQRVPEAVKRIVMFYGEQKQPDEPFASFIARIGLDPLKFLLQDLAELNGAAQTPELFVDLGETEPFAPAAGKGECAE
ncbi:MAG: nitrite/sulfite reductase [Candidatus Omnitrophica bacterium]|nr:nitrite/sulfite reductase [Candidatus Omnitrophota bacterium]